MRYIDADALIENIKRVYCTDCNNYNEIRCRACGTDDALTMIDDAPTANVAPRAELAREIFEEIEKYMVILGDDTLTSYFRGIGWKVFAKLKKKYTEDSK